MNLELQSREVTKELAKGGLIGMTGSLFLKPVNLITGIVLARYLGVEAFGMYSLGLSFVTILNVITNLGFNQGIVRFVSVFRSQNKSSYIRGTFLVTTLISTILCLVIITLVIFWAEDLSIIFFNNLELGTVLILFTLSIPFNSIYMFSASFALAYKKVKYQNFLVNILRPFSFLFLIFIVILLQLELTGTLYANLLSTIITASIGIWIVVKLFPEPLLDFKNFTTDIKSLLNFSVPTLFTGFTAIVLMKIDRIMIGYFLNEYSVGIYSAAASIAINLSIFLTPFATVFAPISAELYHNSKFNELREAFRNTTLWLIIFTLPIFFVFLTFPEELLFIFGKEYSEGAIILMIIASAQLLNVSTGPVGILLKMSGNQYLDLTISIVVLVLNISLNFFLIPIYGSVGAAFATALSIAVTHLMRLFYVYRILNMFPYDIKTLKLILCFALCLSTNFLISEYVTTELTLRFIEAFIVLVLFLLYIYYFIKDEEDKYILSLIKNKIFSGRISRSNFRNKK